MRSADGFVKAGAIDALLGEEQTTASRTPCSFAAKSITLAAGESVTINSVYGHAYSLGHFTDIVAPQASERPSERSAAARALCRRATRPHTQHQRASCRAEYAVALRAAVCRMTYSVLTT